MFRFNTRRLLYLGMAAAVLSAGVLSFAQTNNPPAKPGQQVVITDAAGRKHTYHAPVTDMHRKQVAARMKAAKLKKARGSK